MEEIKISHLKKELKLKEFQFNALYEFSSSIYSAFEQDKILRIFFSTLMGQLGISRAFFFDQEYRILEIKGFQFSLDTEAYQFFFDEFSRLGKNWFYYRVKDLPSESIELKNCLLKNEIFYLINISESKKHKTIVGIGLRFNSKELTIENLELSFFVSRFTLIAIKNTFMFNNLIRAKKMEHEIKIAKDIQLSLLPDQTPQLKNFEISVVYQPSNQIGGDYYDFLDYRNTRVPVLIADVEGKGLPASLLAASSQAVFRSLNELYYRKPSLFIAKANSLIYEFTKGNRFITLCWFLLDDVKKTVSYVNAGHVTPLLLRKNKLINLDKGGLLTGYLSEAEYQEEKLVLESGDIIAIFTDGVTEAEDPGGSEFGRERIIEYLKKNKKNSADRLSAGLHEEVQKFCQSSRLGDDLTLIIIKTR